VSWTSKREQRGEEVVIKSLVGLFHYLLTLALLRSRDDLETSLGQMLFGVFPKAQRSADVHVQRANNTELGNLDALIKDAVVLLRNSLLFFSKKQDDFGGEVELVEHLRVCGLLQSQNLISV